MADDPSTAPRAPEETSPPALATLARLWGYLNKHKVVQWSIAYIALAYSVQQGVGLTAEAFEWPQVVLRVSLLLLALGLPVVATIAWYHGDRGSQRVSGSELTIISMLLVVGAVLIFMFARPSAQQRAAESEQTRVTEAAALPASKPGGISIAVLPFVNLSSEAEQEFFSDGMTEEVTSALVKVRGLSVIGRTSAFEFKGQNKDLRAIGQALGTTHLIEGSVRKAGNRVRITAQLIRTDNGAHLWTENYDRELTDIFLIQESIATAIAGALSVPLGLQQGQHLVSNRIADPASYQQYLRAKTLVRTRGGQSLPNAAALLEPIVADNPEFVPAWAVLAEAYVHLPAYHPALRNGDFPELRRVVDATRPKAEAAARRAIQLDPTFAEAYSTLGLVELARGKQVLAEDFFKKALALDPNNSQALGSYGFLLGGTGRVKEWHALALRLQELEPLGGPPAVTLWLNGETDEAIATLKPIPGAGAARILAMIYASAGRYGEAADALHGIGGGDPKIVMDAERLLRTAPAKAASPENLPRLAALGWVYPHVGELGRALEWYESLTEAGHELHFATAWLWHPSAAPVRKTERFKAYVRKAGLVDYWRARGWPEFCRPQGADDFVCA